MGSLALSWDAAAGADGYRVQWKSGDEAYDPAARQAAVATNGHTIPNLTPGLAVTVRVAATKDGEGAPAQFELTASHAPVGDLSVILNIAGKGDYGVTVGRVTVTIPAGERTATYSVATDDGVDEEDGTVTATLAASVNYYIAAPLRPTRPR